MATIRCYANDRSQHEVRLGYASPNGKMRKSSLIAVLVGVLIETSVALQKYEETDGKQIGKTSYKPGDLLGRLSINKLGEEQTPQAPVESSRQRHKTSLVKPESGENVYEPPFDSAEVVDREDHDDLPDYADFSSDEPVPIMQLTPPEVMTPKEIFRMDPTAIKVETRIKVTTVQKNVEAVVQEVPDEERTVEMDRPATATLMMIPEFVMTTVTPTMVHHAPPKDVKSADGWVKFTPGMAQGPQEKGAPVSTATNKYLRESDALPDAMKLISDLWDDAPVFVTETLYITSKIIRTPVPKAKETSTSTYVKKYDKGKAKPTVMTPLKINTGLLRNHAPFTIAPNDIYRGIHAKSMANQISLSVAVLMISGAAFLVMFM